MNEIRIQLLLNRIISIFKVHKNEEKVKDFLSDLLLFRFASLKAERDRTYFPPDLRWDKLKESQKQNYPLRERIYEAMCFMEGEPEYNGLLYPRRVLEEFDDREISEIFDILGELSWDREKDIGSELIYAYEFLERYGFSQSPKQMGEFYTPRQVGKLIVKLLAPKGGSVYDPCCGSGTMLLCAADYMRERGKNFRLYGQEVVEHAWKTARMNLILRGMDADLGQMPADSIGQDIQPDLKANYVLGNPPFHWYGGNRKLSEDDRRWRYGIPSEKRGDFAWMQHMLYHLNEDGKMGAIFSNGILNSRRTEDRRIRAGILQDDILEAIITLPAGMFYATKVSVSVWILKRHKEDICRNKILFVDARSFGKSEGGITVLSEEELRELTQAYEQYQKGIDGEQKNFCRQVSAAEVEAEDYSLAPDRYILRQQKLLESEELKEQELRLERKLEELLAQNHDVLRQILKGL